MRGALIDDVALAAAVKKGGPIWLGHAAQARSVRPYPHVADIWRMIARTAYVQLRYSPLLLLATVLGMVITWLVPPADALTGEGIAAMLRTGGVGDAVGCLSSDAGALRPKPAVGAVPAARRRVLHGRDHCRRRQSLHWSRGRLEKPHLPGKRRMSSNDGIA